MLTIIALIKFGLSLYSLYMVADLLAAIFNPAPSGSTLTPEEQEQVARIVRKYR